MTQPDRIAEIRAALRDAERSAEARGECALTEEIVAARDLLAALDERDREIERLRAESRCPTCRGDGYIGDAIYDEQGFAADGREQCPDCDNGNVSFPVAFRAGAEAMREACAVEAEQHDAEAEPFIKGGVLRILARDIRALPLPEPKR